MRVWDCRTSFVSFCYDYLPHYFSKWPSAMHEYIFRMVDRIILDDEQHNVALAAPRGNAKSTLLSLALPLWCALYKHKRYILIVSDTASQADEFLNSIRTELEDNQLILQDFGDLEGNIWTRSDILLKSDVRIQALGAGKKVRGRRYKQFRPDLIIGDDLENDENVANEEQRNKMYAWQTKALNKAGAENTDKIFVGTIIHYDSLLNKLLNNPTYEVMKYQAVIEWSKSDLWNQWEGIINNFEDLERMKTAYAFYMEHKDEMLEGTKVLWPEKEDYYNLMVQRISDGPAAFSSEKQNEPLSDEDRIFLPEWIRYYDDDEIVGKKLIVRATIDPSMGKKGGDYSAILVGGQDSNGVIYLLDADIARRHPDIILQNALDKYQQYKYKLLGVEEVQFQEYFKDNIRKEIELNKYNLIVKGIKTHSDKVLRIQSLQPDIKNGRIRFKQGQEKLIQQLVNFPHADHDDGPDALEMLVDLFGRNTGMADFYKAQAHDNNANPEKSFIRNLALQGGLARLSTDQ